MSNNKLLFLAMAVGTLFFFMSRMWVQSEKISSQQAQIAALETQVAMITPAPMPVIMPELYISFDPAMPSSRTVAPGRTNVEFVRLEFAAVGETVIRGLSISRKGGTDQDLQEVSLFDGSTQLSSSKRMDDGKTHFDGLNWVIPAYTVKTLTVKATISGTAAVGHEIRLGINSGKDINTDTNLDGLLFPIMGNAMTVR